MADDAIFSVADDGLSPNSSIGITIEEGSENSEELLDVDKDDSFENVSNDFGDENDRIIRTTDLENAINQVLGIERCDLENENEPGFDSVDIENESEHVLEFESNSDVMIEIPSNSNQGNSYLPPIVGTEFESYDDAYKYYNCYAKERGFGIRVKSSWTKRNSKEKRGAVLCCNCEGFKTMKEANSRRKETRTGCLAMIRLRLVESNRWKLDEVRLEHNHIFDPERAQSSRSHKKIEAGSKRKLESSVDVEVQTIKLYRTPVVDISYGNSNETEFNKLSKSLKLGKSGAFALFSYFREAQLVDPNFFYVMDFSDEGHVKNVFWTDSRSRASYGYFGDVVFIDTTCLSNDHNIPFLAFTGLNHHGQSMLLGCGFLVDETIETYSWLMRAWLTCMSGRPPQTIITDQCKALQGAISEVFPRAHHRFYLPLIMQRIHRKIGESEIFRSLLNKIVYNSLKVEDFEMGWEKMIQNSALGDNEYLQSLYGDREKWVPVFLKDTLLAGIYIFQPGNPFFHEHLHEKMTWDEFFSIYESIKQKMTQKEAVDDFESKEFNPIFKTSCNYELQLSEIYTKKTFLKFQEEIVMMSNCFGIAQIHINGTIITYMVKEQESDGESKNFEVVSDKTGIDVRCSCSCFNFRGYLCRHALSVLNYNGMKEIPNQYILTRWRKDLKRLYSIDLGLNNIDISNPVQWFDHLYRRAMQVVTEGMVSEDHHMVAWQAFKELLNKVRPAVARKPL